jgi:type VI secretion system secreted protein Hcp
MALSLSTDFFLKIEGIPGESKRSGHEKEMELLSFSFGATQTGTAELGSGQTGAARVEMQDFHFVKPVDSSSPKLVQHMFTGKFIPAATFSARRIGLEDGKPLKYMIWEFKNLVISSHSFNGAGAGDVPMESISFRFEEVKCYYREIKAGVPQGPISAGWNVKTNKEV